MSDVGASPAVVQRIGDWQIDPGACRLTRNGTSVKVSPRSMSVLVYLAERAGETVIHEELLAAFWRGAVSSPNAVHKAVTELRHALGNGDAGPAYIETVPKRGYRLVAEVVRVERPVNGAPRSEASADLEGDEAITPSIAATASGPEARDAPPERRRRAALAVGAISLTAAIAWWFLRSDPVPARVVAFGDHAAVLLPASSQSDADRLEEAILDKALTRLGALPGYDIRTQVLQSGIPPRDAAISLGVDFAIDVGVTETDGHLHAELAILPSALNEAPHREQIDRPQRERAAFVDDVTDHVVEDLAVLMDDAKVAQMAEWGTRNVHAYRLAVEGDSFQRIQTIDSLRVAEDRFRKAIEEDATFPYAFVSLAAIYQAIAMNPRNTDQLESTRRRAQDLLREASAKRIEPSALALVARQYEDLALANAFDAEALWRGMLTRDPRDFEAIRSYAWLLAGSKLFEEHRALIEYGLSLGPDVGWRNVLESEYPTARGAAGDHEAVIAWNKKTVERYPDFTLALYGLVTSLAHVGRFQEAESYLVRLQATDPVWGSAGSLVLRVKRGDLTRGSADFERVLADRSNTNALRGILCFMVGDVERGVGFWREIEPAYLRMLWHFISSEEQHFVEGVVADRRYQALLDDLGIGRKWRAYMRERVAELTPVIGIRVTSPLPPEDVAAL